MEEHNKPQNHQVEPTQVAAIHSARFSKKTLGLLVVLGLLAIASVALFFTYRSYIVSYQKVQKSRVSNSIAPTTVDLGGLAPTSSTLQGIGLLQVNGDAIITNNVTANSFSGSGADLSNVNATRLNSQPGSFYQNATNIDAGTLGDQFLSPNVALLDANQAFTGSNSFGGSSNFTGAVVLPGTLTINSLTYNMPGSQAAGSLSNDGAGNLIWQAAGACPTCVNTGGNSFGAAMSVGTNDNFSLSFRTNAITRLTFDTTGNATFAGTIVGNGSGITNLNASNISSGTLAVANGGTGMTGFTQYGLLFGNAAGALGVTAAGINNQCLVGNTAAAPSWIACNIISAGAQPGGSAGGDLGGTYPNPTIAKLQSTDLLISLPLNGQILAYNTLNSRWDNISSSLVCPAGSGNLSGGGNSVNVGLGGTCGALSTIANPSFGTSVTTPLLQATGALTIATLATGGSDDIIFSTAGSEKLRLLENGDLSFEKGSFDLTIGTAAITGSNKTITFPNESGTVCTTGSVCSGYAPSSGSSNYIQNQTASTQTAGFTISGTGTVATLNATSAIQFGGANINTGGTLNNVAYLNQANVFTLGNTFSGGITTNTINPTSAITIGNTGLQFTLQGNELSTITATGGVGNTGKTTIGFSGTTANNVTYNFDRTPAPGSYNVCTTYTLNNSWCGNYAVTNSFVYNQIASAQSGKNNIGDGNFWISGTGIVGTKLGVGISSNTFGTVEKLRINTPTTTDNTANVMLATSATTSKGLAIQGKALQTANLQEWQDSTGSAMSVVDPNGKIGVGTNTPNYNLDVRGGKAPKIGYGGYSAVTSGTCCTLNSISTSINVSNSYLNRYLLVVLSYYSSTATVSSITYNGLPMHLVSTLSQNTNRQNIYAINEAELADNGAGVARNVSVSLSANVRVQLTAAYFYNVSQATDLWSPTYNPLPGVGIATAQAASSYYLSTSITPASSGGGDYLFLAGSATNGNWDIPIQGFSGLPGTTTNISTQWADDGTFAAVIETRVAYTVLSDQFRQSPIRVFLDASAADTGSSNLTLQAVALQPAASTINPTGAVVSFSSNCPAASCTDTANILSINQQYASSTGSVLNISNSGTGADITLGSGIVAGTTSSGIVFKNTSNSATAFTVQNASGTKVLTIATDTTNSRVGVGNVAPTVSLDVLSASADATTVAQFKNAGATSCTVQPGGTNFACSSDARLKTNVVTISDPNDILTKLRGVNFNWKSNPDGATNYGFIAQELMDVLPSAVSTDSDGYYVANYQAIIPYLVEGFKKQQTQIDNLTGTSVDVLKTLADANAIELKGDLTIGGILIVKGNTNFDGDVTFNSDSAGTATIATGSTNIHIAFTKTLPVVPLVNITPKDFITGGFKVTNETTTGFDIELESTQPNPALFNWDYTIVR